MRRIQFKSLSMRIWTMLIVMCVGIVILISTISGMLITRMERDYQKELLEVGHQWVSDTFIKGANIEEDLDQIDLRTILKTEHILLTQNSNNNSYTVSPLGRRMQVMGPEAKDVIDYFIQQIDSKGIKNQLYILPLNEHNLWDKNEKIYSIIEEIESPQKMYLITYTKAIESPILSIEIINIAVIFIISSFGIAKVIANSICKPLKELEGCAFKIANKEWVGEIPVESSDEIGSLVESINYMQAELQKKDQEQKKFLQSISHDLKTPIMVIEGHAQAIMDGMYIDTVEDTADIILEEAKRLEAKVSKMLYFNTLDYMLEKKDAMKEIEILPIIQRLVQKFQLLNTQIEWQVDLEEVSIKGNKEQLEVAIENILDNQLRYAKSKIVVNLSRQKKHMKLSISNDGPCISADKLIQVFDHLYKDSGGKFGLGLAITKKIVHFHKGSIEVINLEQGVEFIIII